MSHTPTHKIYSRDATVYLVTGEDKLETFHQTIEQSGFLSHVNNQWRASGKAKESFLIAIKPNIMTASIYEQDSAVYTDPFLVEVLIDVLRSEGYERYVVVESQNVFNYSYKDRDVPAVASMCGYKGSGYEIVDLTEDQVEYDYGGVLGLHTAGRSWLNADYRISFAKNKTHWQCFYTACIKNVYGCLPQWDKMHHYHGRNIEFYQAAVLIADKFPVNFGFLDAWTSGDGFSGHVRDSQPNRTKTFLASENIYALDWVAGEKMKVNPTHNYVIREALMRWGPIQITRIGNMMPWLPWTNVRAFTVRLLNVLEERYWLSRFASRMLASQMDKRFPPVDRWKWFFGITQAIVRLIEGVGTTQTRPDAREALTFSMEL